MRTPPSLFAAILLAAVTGASMPFGAMRPPSKLATVARSTPRIKDPPVKSRFDLERITEAKVRRINRAYRRERNADRTKEGQRLASERLAHRSHLQWADCVTGAAA